MMRTNDQAEVRQRRRDTDERGGGGEDEERTNLYGTCLPRSTSALITRPRVRSDWLIMPASLARLSSAPERPMFSDPARSTRLNFPTLSRSSPVGDDSLMCTVIEKTECDRLMETRGESRSASKLAESGRRGREED